MKRIVRLSVLVAATVFLLTSCANFNKQGYGTLFGSVAGGLIGHQLGGDKGMIAGALVGGLVGNRIGAHLDEQDRAKLAALEKKALDTGKGGSFVTNKTKAKVTVTASKTVHESKESLQPTTDRPRTIGKVGQMQPTNDGPGTAGKTVKVSMQCKVLTRKVEPEDDTSRQITESIKYCKAPPKGWQTV